MRRRRAIVAWSSGKDSAYALHLTRTAGEHEIAAILTTVTSAFERIAVHGVREELLRRQAQALGLPSVQVTLPHPCTNAAYESAIGDALRSARDEHGIADVIYGDLFLADIRAYREAQLAALGLHGVFPLWGRDTGELAREMLDVGIVARIVALDPAKVDRRFAGHPFDRAFLAALPRSVDPCGENGEFHTCVTDGPMLRAPIAVVDGVVVERDGVVFADLVPA